MLRARSGIALRALSKLCAAEGVRFGAAAPAGAAVALAFPFAGSASAANISFAVTGPSFSPARWYSELAEQKEGEQPVVYEGPFAGAVRRVKKLSLFSCCCAVAAGPIILGLDAQNTLQAKLMIAGTLTSFGVFTTGLMHWFTHPYVQRLVYHPQTDEVEVTNLSLFAKPTTRRFHLAEAREADTVHPLTSFEVQGEYYYIDAEHFPYKALLARLVPQAAAAAATEGAEAEIQGVAAGRELKRQQQDEQQR